MWVYSAGTGWLVGGHEQIQQRPHMRTGRAAGGRGGEVAQAQPRAAHAKPPLCRPCTHCRTAGRAPSKSSSQRRGAMRTASLSRGSLQSAWSASWKSSGQSNACSRWREGGGGTGCVRQRTGEAGTQGRVGYAWPDGTRGRSGCNGRGCPWNCPGGKTRCPCTFKQPENARQLCNRAQGAQFAACQLAGRPTRCAALDRKPPKS